MKATSRYRIRERVFLFFTTAVCAAVLTGCCLHRPSQFVVVPEAVFRTEKSIADRIRLPLTPDGRQRVTNFLAGNASLKYKGGSSDPAVKRELELVKPLLDFLTEHHEHQLSADDIKSGTAGALTSYLGKTFVRQIVDGRNYDQRNVFEEPPEGAEWVQYPPWPFAFRHGSIWWVFFPNDAGKVTGLMLAAEITREKPNN